MKGREYRGSLFGGLFLVLLQKGSNFGRFVFCQFQQKLFDFLQLSVIRVSLPTIHLYRVLFLQFEAVGGVVHNYDLV